MWGMVRSRLKAHWIACRLISDKKSVRYGIRFSYPLYISAVFFGVLSENPYILFVTALIALLGMFLPMHPLDYVYNRGVAPLIGLNKIHGRGSELQVNSNVALVFSLCVIALILFNVPINFLILAVIYLISSIFFLCVFLLRKD